MNELSKRDRPRGGEVPDDYTRLSLRSIPPGLSALFRSGLGLELTDGRFALSDEGIMLLRAVGRFPDQQFFHQTGMSYSHFTGDRYPHFAQVAEAFGAFVERQRPSPTEAHIVRMQASTRTHNNIEYLSAYCRSTAQFAAQSDAIASAIRYMVQSPLMAVSDTIPLNHGTLKWIHHNEFNAEMHESPAFVPILKSGHAEIVRQLSNKPRAWLTLKQHRDAAELLDDESWSNFWAAMIGPDILPLDKVLHTNLSHLVGSPENTKEPKNLPTFLADMAWTIAEESADQVARTRLLSALQVLPAITEQIWERTKAVWLGLHLKVAPPTPMI